MKTISRVFSFYYDGFKNLKVGKSLWKIVIIKLLVIFVVLNYFVYDKNLNTEYKTIKEKQDFIFTNLTKGK
ncbi:DUF4492 domain-containing protein [Malaciobacter molluscorum LMG 25693]|uniref:DUF4492 domain-containing protein n=1 Tax=Malaciobacter molluscorum LMG 25693 TaxID=870501 RepID=A0A2G1DEN4_9BACT|nr:DUF4492 domain-containing protein [Malaciobacter molluscorum]AXX93070.1 DUF4492 domain-containing protein [Malaciobacter molluscorum LMG 25693]PHO16962.1 DUF4492 domain-containing protein [Malaciobacter molluscorum LMG 25693]RXJ95541.1 DUF4492 domain-containing protein [Malaciobacter molluscorum]